MKIIKEEISFKKVVKDIEVKLKNGKTIIVEKSIINDCLNDDYDSDYRIISGNNIYNEMSEEEQEEFDDFINETIIK